MISFIKGKKISKPIWFGVFQTIVLLHNPCEFEFQGMN